MDDGIENEINADLKTVATWLEQIGSPSSSLFMESEWPEPAQVAEARQRLTFLSARDILATERVASAAEVVDDHINRLGERQVCVLRERLFADSPRTLDELGDLMGVTRERVRQIEKKARAALERELKLDWLSAVADLMLSHARPAVAVSDVLRFAPALADIVSSVGQPLWRVFDRLDDSYEIAQGWCAAPSLSNATRATREQVGLAAAGKSYVLIDDIEGLASSALDHRWLEISGIHTSGGFAFTSSPSIGDRAMVALEVAGQPLSASDILEAIGSDRSLNSVKNALAVQPEIVRVDRDSWALAKWGMSEYRAIKELIAQQLETHGGEMRLSALLLNLTTEFSVAESSIIAYASSVPFAIQDGFVVLSPFSQGRRGRPLRSSKRVYRTSRGIAFRIQVTKDHLRGSGSPLPSAVAVELGIGRGEVRDFESKMGLLRLSYSKQPILGSIRRFLLQDGIEVGEELLLLFSADDQFDLVKTESQGHVGIDRAARMLGLYKHQTLQRFCARVDLPAGANMSQLIGAFRDRGEFDVAEALQMSP